MVKESIQGFYVQLKFEISSPYGMSNPYISPLSIVCYHSDLLKMCRPASWLCTVAGLAAKRWDLKMFWDYLMWLPPVTKSPSVAGGCATRCTMQPCPTKSLEISKSETKNPEWNVIVNVLYPCAFWAYAIAWVLLWELVVFRSLVGFQSKSSLVQESLEILKLNSPSHERLSYCWILLGSGVAMMANDPTFVHRTAAGVALASLYF